jgi:DeoR family transcriptional regulator, ulaG and ulaABCDEF operon transcriptional repressor
MLEAERHRVILKLLQERSIVSITDLVEIIGASDATLRRDVNSLAEAGKVRRIRGGVEALNPRHEPHLVGMPFAISREVAVAQKRAIARAAAELISDGESIIINAGTTTLALVEFIANRQLDILTNSMPILAALHSSGGNRISVPGGTVFREQNIIISPFEDHTVESFWASKLITGCFGINEHGLMEADPLIVQAQTRLLRRADQVIVLADSRKLRQRSSIIVAPLKQVSVLITDEGASAADLESVRQAGVRVIIARTEQAAAKKTA